MTKRLRGLGAAALVGVLASVAGPAGAAYVTDKLMVGVHEGPQAAGEPARLVQGGTPVEVLKRSGEYLEVRLPDGGTGWVETRFVTDDRPATFLLLEAQASKAALERKMADLQQREGQPPPVVAVPEPTAPLPATGLGGWWLWLLALPTFGLGYLVGRWRP